MENSVWGKRKTSNQSTPKSGKLFSTTYMSFVMCYLPRPSCGAHTVVKLLQASALDLDMTTHTLSPEIVSSQKMAAPASNDLI